MSKSPMTASIATGECESTSPPFCGLSSKSRKAGLKSLKSTRLLKSSSVVETIDDHVWFMTGRYPVAPTDREVTGSSSVIHTSLLGRCSWGRVWHTQQKSCSLGSRRAWVCFARCEVLWRISLSYGQSGRQYGARNRWAPGVNLAASADQPIQGRFTQCGSHIPAPTNHDKPFQRDKALTKYPFNTWMLAAQTKVVLNNIYNSQW